MLTGYFVDDTLKKYNQNLHHDAKCYHEYVENFILLVTSPVIQDLYHRSIKTKSFLETLPKQQSNHDKKIDKVDLPVLRSNLLTLRGTADHTSDL